MAAAAPEPFPAPGSGVANGRAEFRTPRGQTSGRLSQTRPGQRRERSQPAGTPPPPLSQPEPPLTWAGRTVVRAGASRALSRASRRSSACLLRPLRRRRCTAAARLPRLPDEPRAGTLRGRAGREGSRAPAAAGWAGQGGARLPSLAAAFLEAAGEEELLSAPQADRGRRLLLLLSPPPSAIATHRKAAHPTRGETRVAEAAPSAPAPSFRSPALGAPAGKGKQRRAPRAPSRLRRRPRAWEARRGRRCGAPPPLLGQHLPTSLPGPQRHALPPPQSCQNSQVGRRGGRRQLRDARSGVWSRGAAEGAASRFARRPRKICPL